MTSGRKAALGRNSTAPISQRAPFFPISIDRAHDPALVGCRADRRAACVNSRAAAAIVHPAAPIVWIKAIGIAACDSEAVQDGGGVRPAAGEHVVGVAIVEYPILVDVADQEGGMRA